MKLFKKLALVATINAIAILPAKATENSFIKLTYSDSQIQCSSNSPLLDIAVDVYYNDTLVGENLVMGDSIFVPNLEGVSMSYSAINSPCSLATPTELHLTKNDPLPNIPGAYGQDDIVALLDSLESYEDLYLVELGTTDINSFAYDLQDVVFIVNNNPTIFYAD